VSAWITIGTHRVQVLPGGGVLWEHDTPAGYPARRHLVDPAAGQTWTVTAADPLTLDPSLHCDPELGGCGVHGWIRDGRWVPA
jgi:uncharacterized protein DUF6527